MLEKDEIVKFAQIHLDREKVTVRKQIPTQILQDMNFEVHFDSMTRTMVCDLSTFVYKVEETEPHTVKAIFEKKLWSFPEFKVLVLFNAVFCLGFLAIMAGMTDSLPYVFYPLFFLLSQVPALFLASGKIKYSKNIDVDVTKISKFPDNTEVFPKTLGKPIITYTANERL